MGTIGDDAACIDDSVIAGVSIGNVFMAFKGRGDIRSKFHKAAKDIKTVITEIRTAI